LCRATEVVITGVIHPATKGLTLWLTETDKNGQFELVGMIEQPCDDLESAFTYVRDALTRGSW